MGSLSPKTRNSQVELYQSGDANFLVATDAIGMGINMDLDNVYFSNLKKFDGKKLRRLNLYEIGQIAGRAGRYKNNGYFYINNFIISNFFNNFLYRLSFIIFNFNNMNFIFHS